VTFIFIRFFLKYHDIFISCLNSMFVHIIVCVMSIQCLYYAFLFNTLYSTWKCDPIDIKMMISGGRNVLRCNSFTTPHISAYTCIISIC
jgi:hypothetical protein